MRCQIKLIHTSYKQHRAIFSLKLPLLCILVLFLERMEKIKRFDEVLQQLLGCPLLEKKLGLFFGTNEFIKKGVG